MDVFIALYRGINIGGKHAVKMQSLRDMHERLGHRDVRNYIQSGNIIFRAKGSTDATARKIAAEFAAEFGFSASVLVVDATRWSTIVTNNPYAEFAGTNPRTVHAGICQGKPSSAGLRALQAKTAGSEAFSVMSGIVYLHAPDGFGTSKFAAGMEKACGVPMTVRNWRTVEAIWQMIQQFD